MCPLTRKATTEVVTADRASMKSWVPEVMALQTRPRLQSPWNSQWSVNWTKANTLWMRPVKVAHVTHKEFCEKHSDFVFESESNPRVVVIGYRISVTQETGAECLRMDWTSQVKRHLLRNVEKDQQNDHMKRFDLAILFFWSHKRDIISCNR